MKKNYILILMLVLSLGFKAQDTIRFESFGLPVDSSWNGSDLSGMFTENGIDFINNYNATYNSWDGFSYSAKRDTTTAGYTNDLSCIAAKGANNSLTYGVGYVGYATPPTINLNSVATSIDGFWVNNSTYAYLSMKNGDSFAKKFGDTVGGSDGKDWLILTTYVHSAAGTDTVDFYMADFRFADSTLDYIVKDWTYVTLPPNTNPTSLTFKMSSSDNHIIYGMNTPAYFCIDNIVYNTPTTDVLVNNKIDVNVFPNPSTNYVNVAVPNNIKNYSVSLIDVNGRLVKSVANINTAKLVLDVTTLTKGMYILSITKDNVTTSKQIIKN